MSAGAEFPVGDPGMIRTHEADVVGVVSGGGAAVASGVEVGALRGEPSAVGPDAAALVPLPDEVPFLRGHPHRRDRGRIRLYGSVSGRRGGHGVVRTRRGGGGGPPGGGETRRVDGGDVASVRGFRPCPAAECPAGVRVAEAEERPDGGPEWAGS